MVVPTFEFPDLESLLRLQNPTGGRHTPTPWVKRGECGIGTADGMAIAGFARPADRDLALYFVNVHAGMIALLREAADSFDFIANGSDATDGTRPYARDRAENFRIYAELFCRLGKVESTADSASARKEK